MGSQSYSLVELIEILKTPVIGDASLILAHQLIAAKANIELGSDPVPIANVISQADSLLSGYSGKLPYLVKSGSKEGNQMTKLAKILDDYNNRLLTPSCNPLTPRLALNQSERDIQRLKVDVAMLASASGQKKEKLHQLQAMLDWAILNRENPEVARIAILMFETKVLDLIREAAIPVKQGQYLIEKAGRIMLRLSY